MFPKKSLWSESWTTLLGPRPDDPVIDLMAISTLGITTLTIVVKIASKTQVSTPATTFSFFFMSVGHSFQ